MGEPFDVLILSNGPGEVSTWVRPVARELSERWPGARISLILAPDVNSSGKEAEMAAGFVGIARVQPAKDYLKFLLTGRTAQNWDWARRGIVLFLGGDQGFSAFIARRMGYPIVAYAEWEARWPRWFNRFGLREESVRGRSTKERFSGQFQVVGDLMIDAVQPDPAARERLRTLLGAGQAGVVALLPGSKPLKLSLGIPLFLGAIDRLARERPGLSFFIPVAPGLSGDDLARYARPDNPDLALVGGESAVLHSEHGADYLVCPSGTRVRLFYERPAYDLLALSDLALTTVGANTAELGILGVPMVVVIPTNRWDVMRAWDGVPGLLSALPVVGGAVASFINRRIVGRLGLLAWPNIRAGRMVVPELCRHLTASDLVPVLSEWLDDPERRTRTSIELKEVMGKTGAVKAFVDLADAVLRC